MCHDGKSEIKRNLWPKRGEWYSSTQAENKKTTLSARVQEGTKALMGEKKGARKPQMVTKGETHLMQTKLQVSKKSKH